MSSAIIILIVLICSISIPLIVAYIIGLWKMFEKAGVPGWKGLIPIYNTWNLVKISDLNWWYFLFMISTISMSFDIHVIIPSISLLSLTAYFFCYYNIAKKLNKDTGFAVLMTFFPFVMIPIVGFSTNYQFDDSVEVSPNGPIDSKNNSSNNNNTNENSKYCSQCGEKIDADSKFCEKCGSKIK